MPRARYAARSTCSSTLVGVNPFRVLSLEPLAGLPPSTKLIWCHLALEGGVVEAGINPLSRTLALATKSVVDGLRELEALGLIEVVDAGGGPKPKKVRAVAPSKGQPR
jgi:hypothetical protein